MKMIRTLAVSAFAITSLAGLQGQTPRDVKSGEEARAQLPSARRLSDREIETLERRRSALMEQLIEERNAERTAGSKRAAAEKTQKRAALRASQQEKLRELSDIAEKLRSSAQPES